MFVCSHVENEEFSIRLESLYFCCPILVLLWYNSIDPVNCICTGIVERIVTKERYPYGFGLHFIRYCITDTDKVIFDCDNRTCQSTECCPVYQMLDSVFKVCFDQVHNAFWDDEAPWIYFVHLYKFCDDQDVS